MVSTQQKYRAPRSHSEHALERAGIHLRDASGSTYGCNACGRGWAVDAPPHGRRMGRGWWKCPNGCNSNRE